jgi:flagellar hook-associated protein 2
MGISVGGLISGMDTDTIITKLLDLEKKPITQLQQKETDYQVKISAYGTLMGNLKTLKNASKNLDGILDIRSFSAVSGNTGLLTVAVENMAVAGSYSVTVNQLAAAHKLTSSGFTPTDAIGKGTIHLALGSNDAVDISVDAGSTISDVAKSINDADTGVYASVINDGTSSFLTLTGKQTGAANVISLTVTEDGTDDPQLAANLDATGLSRLVYTTSVSYKGESGGSGVASDLTINGITVTDSADMTELVDNINRDVSGVSASLQTDGSLLLTNTTGNDIIIGGATTNTGLTTGTYKGRSNFASVDAANSEISVDGVKNISRSTNTITDVINGVTLNLKSTDPNKPVTVSIEHSNDLFTTRLSEFLDAYNALTDSLGNLQSYDAQTKETGMLFGDSTTRRIQTEMRNLFSNSVPGLPTGLSRLANLGVSTDEDGKLVLDSTVFEAKLKDNYDDVAEFFTKTDVGYAVRMTNSLVNMLDPTSGLLAVRTDGLQGSIDVIDDQISRLNVRLSNSETRLRTQFAALETLLGKYQSTSDSLTAELEQLSNNWGTNSK